MMKKNKKTTIFY